MIAQIHVSLWLFAPPRPNLDTTAKPHASRKLCVVMLAFNPKNQDLAVISFIEGRLSSFETLSTTLLFLSITPDLPHQWLRVFGRPIFRPAFAYVCAVTAANVDEIWVQDGLR
ncbi:MAG TPA: hypothetical protein DEQ55_02700 [Pseudomonas sp.]|nr:hypothetical protein [Pseudomonas sp.]